MGSRDLPTGKIAGNLRFRFPLGNPFFRMCFTSFRAASGGLLPRGHPRTQRGGCPQHINMDKNSRKTTREGRLLCHRRVRIAPGRRRVLLRVREWRWGGWRRRPGWPVVLPRTSGQDSACSDWKQPILRWATQRRLPLSPLDMGALPAKYCEEPKCFPWKTSARPADRRIVQNPLRRGGRAV